ncbi:MAG TPA: flagellar basal body-associated FliL family protein [Terriglobales bacterium]
MSAQETEVVQPKSSSKKVIFVLAAVVVLGACGAAWFLHQRRAKPPVHQEPKKTEVLHLETFVVNLADEDQRTFLRIGIDLGVESEGKKSKEGEAERPISPIRDVILGVLMSTRSDDLATVEGKQKLKEELLHRLNQHLPELKVHEIYFTEYILQR